MSLAAHIPESLTRRTLEGSLPKLDRVVYRFIADYFHQGALDSDFLPTIDEVYPGYEALSWHAVFVPAGTPQPIIERLQKEIAPPLEAA